MFVIFRCHLTNEPVCLVYMLNAYISCTPYAFIFRSSNFIPFSIKSNILPVSTGICQVFVHCIYVVQWCDALTIHFSVSTDFGENPNEKFEPTKPHSHNAYRVYLVLSKRWTLCNISANTPNVALFLQPIHLIFIQRTFILAIISKRDPKFKWHICALFFNDSF